MARIVAPFFTTVLMLAGTTMAARSVDGTLQRILLLAMSLVTASMYLLQWQVSSTRPLLRGYMAMCRSSLARHSALTITLTAWTLWVAIHVWRWYSPRVQYPWVTLGVIVAMLFTAVWVVLAFRRVNRESREPAENEISTS